MLKGAGVPGVIDPVVIQVLSTAFAAVAGAAGSIGAIWSHQSRDAVRDLQARVLSVENVLMGRK